MFSGRFAYLLSDIIFAGFPAIFIFSFYYHIIKVHFKVMVKLIIIFTIFASIFEQTGFAWNTWQLSPDRYMGFDIFGSSLETYLFTILVTFCISSAIYIWTYYEDNSRLIRKTGFTDISNGTYAIWRREEPK